MPRLFIAIDPPEEILKHICEFRRALKGVRWTPTEQVHLTITFIGESTDEQKENIIDSLQKVIFPKFQAKLYGTGFFPSRRRPSIFWAGIEMTCELDSLKKTIDSELSKIGLPIDEGHDFKPHMTVARIKYSNRESVEFLERLRFPSDKLFFEVASFRLMSSILCPHGAVHKTEAVIKSTDYQ